MLLRAPRLARAKKLVSYTTIFLSVPEVEGDERRVQQDARGEQGGGGRDPLAPHAPPPGRNGLVAGARRRGARRAAAGGLPGRAPGGGRGGAADRKSVV